MRFSTLLIAVLSALILGLSALLAVGCGSSDSGGSGSTSSAQQTDASQTGESTESESQSSGPPLSKAAFLKQGDTICALVPNDFKSRLASLEEERKAAKEPKPDPAEITKEASIPPLETAVTKLKGLNPPAGDEQKVEAIIAALESAAAGLEKNPKAEFGGPKSPFAEFQKLTKEYGFKICLNL